MDLQDQIPPSLFVKTVGAWTSAYFKALVLNIHALYPA